MTKIYFKKILFLIMIIGFLSSVLFYTLNQVMAEDNELLSEIEKELLLEEELRGEYICEEIPYGKHLIKTKMHLEEFLPLVIELKQLAKEILKRSHKLVFLSQDCKSSNCVGQCVCVVEDEDNHFCVERACVDGRRPVCYHISRMTEENRKLQAAKDKFEEVYEKLLELEPALDDLLKENIKIADSFAVFYEQRHVTSLYDCFKLMDMRIPTAMIRECPWDGNNYFHCR